MVVAGDVNAYSYAFDDPVNLIDSNRQVAFLPAFAVGGAVGFGAALVPVAAIAKKGGDLAVLFRPAVQITRNFFAGGSANLITQMALADCPEQWDWGSAARSAAAAASVSTITLPGSMLAGSLGGEIFEGIAAGFLDHFLFNHQTP